MKRVLLSFCLVAAFSACHGTPAKKMVILGVDGMDPKLLQEFMTQGELPHFQKLASQGDFKPLQTTMPPLSPVAWSTFITGMDPGGHAIFDFIHRDPATVTPEFSMVKTSASNWTIPLGDWLIPLRGGKIEQLRQGRAFWELLNERGIPSTVVRMPVNFPPAAAGKSLSGMGTPDIVGTAGTFTFYTDDPPPNADSISGGTVVRVAVEDGIVKGQLVGPENAFRREPASPEQQQTGGAEYTNPTLHIDFSVFVDPEAPAAKFAVQNDEFVLKQGEWSDWVRVDFEALPYLVHVSAIARFYLQQVHPHFRLFVTPLQINPEDPVMPISYPQSWSKELQRSVGYFYTQELPEDSKAFSAGIINGDEFWEQSQFVYREQRKSLDQALAGYRDGLLFFYFSSVDQGSHMLWQYMDSDHPLYVRNERLKDGIKILYREMDEALGRIMDSVGPDATIIVMSDHGFAPFYWQVNLNSWLAQQGYTRLIDPSKRDGYPLFTNVDWSQTQAYAVGLNGLYVNLQGREARGIVSDGDDYHKLLDRLEADLLAMKDPRNGRSPISLVVQTRRDLKGKNLNRAPDIIIGYNWGYRSSWKNPLGEFPRDIFLDNKDPWSGDHSMDYRLVPGVLVTNRKITSDKPALYDLTVSVLDAYGIAPIPGMLGSNCLK